MAARLLKHARKLSTPDSPSANGDDEARQIWSPQDLHTRIAQRAFILYVQRNFEEGHALDDWLQAEQEILGQASK